MSADEPFIRHDGALLLLLLQGCSIAFVWLTVAGIRRLFRALRRRESPLLPAALLAWGATVAVYAWGLILLGFADDYYEDRECDKAVGDRTLIGYEPTFLPLRFGCETDDGDVVQVIIPGWLNPSGALLTLCAAVLTAVHIAQRRQDR
ncbi:hypothetical protein [Streptomyces sp. NPDC049881]|uniref:hypothetical protein n=1 Tax=Streptomyces sp. NPDC049881 TaxID=3155778 RepID=UPI003420B3EA